MNVDPAAILALISTLTAQNAQLQQENAKLKAESEARERISNAPA